MGGIEAMRALLSKLIEFEKRNNISAYFQIHSDGSGSLHEFWDNDELLEFTSYEDLEKFLEKTQYKLSENGRCIVPHIIVKT